MVSKCKHGLTIGTCYTCITGKLIKRDDSGPQNGLRDVCSVLASTCEGHGYDHDWNVESIDSGIPRGPRKYKSIGYTLPDTDDENKKKADKRNALVNHIKQREVDIPIGMRIKGVCPHCTTEVIGLWNAQLKVGVARCDKCGARLTAHRIRWSE